MVSALLGAASVAVAPAFAGPTGGTVVSGQAVIQSLQQETLIKQGTSKAIINWNAFSILANESVVFQQPNSSSIALNRVVGNAISTILGALSANGQVWLINPNGVLFGKSATVNAAGVLATTSNIANSDFMAGNYNFNSPSANPNAGIVNYGTINTPGGSTVLAAPTVDNEGTITARLGSVAIGAGSTFAVDFDGDNLLSFAVTSPAANAQVTNGGTIAADGGTVQITANAAGAIVDNVINTSGIVQANSVAIKNGTVILDGGNGGVNVTGTISTQGNTANATGGTVKLLGNSVTLGPTASINASGQAGGGTVLVGGSFHGAGPEPDAAIVTVDQGATIDADATVSGNGGNVAVWSNESTTFDGTITARGGPQGGNGGYVETSSHSLTVGNSATVDTLAPNGLVGNWLLDPTDVVVANSGGTITPATIDASASNVTLQATGGDITFSDAVSMTNNGVGLTAEAGNSIFVNAPITTKGGNITLSADDPNSSPTYAGQIQLNAPLNTAGNNQTGGNVVLTSQDESGGGSITLGSNITTNGGSVVFTGSTEMVGNAVINAAGADTTFDDNIYGGDYLLKVSGRSVTFNGDVGPGSLDTSGTATTIISGIFVTTSGDQSYGPELLLGANTNLNSLAGNINADFIDDTAIGAHTLSISAGGTVTIAGGIGQNGGQAPTGAVTLSGTQIYLGGDITTAGGAVTITNPVVLSNNVTIATNAGGSAGGAIAFWDSIENPKGSPGTYSLTLNSGTAETDIYDAIGDTSALSAFIVSSAGQLNLNDVGITTTTGGVSLTANAISFACCVVTAGGPVQINGPVTLTGVNGGGSQNDSAKIDTTAGGTVPGGASVTFNGTVDEANTANEPLKIQAGNGAVAFNGPVGGINPLPSLYVSGGTIALAPITTAGPQSYIGASTISVGGNLTDTTPTDIALTGNVTIAAPNLTIATAGNVSNGNIVITGPVSGDTDTLTLDAGGASGGLVWNNGTLTCPANACIEGPTQTLSGTVDTSTLNQTEHILLTGNTTFTNLSGSLTVTPSIDLAPGTSTATLTVTQQAGSTGGIGLAGSIGDGNAVGAVAINSATGGGSITLGGTAIQTASATVSLNGPTIIANNLTIDTTVNSAGGAPGTGATVTFASTLDDSTSNHTLTIAAGELGDVDFEGRVGTEYQNGINFNGNGQSPGAVIITSADNINMTMPLGPNGDGFSVGEFIVEGAGSPTGTTPGAATLTTSSFISTNTGGNGGLINIVTTGNVSVGLDIFTVGGSGVVGNVMGSGGSVTINAGRSVAIGGGISLTSTGSGNNVQVTSPLSIMTDGAGIQSAGQTPGGGGAITLTGTSIDLYQGASSTGGDAVASGATANGATGGAISLIASAGNVTIGSAADGDLVGLQSRGGRSTGGAAGTGGDVTLSGNALSFAAIETSDRASPGGAITLIATATSGPAVTIYGNGDNASTTDVSAITGDFALNGSNVTIESGVDGHGNPLPLQGSAYIQLVDNSANAQNYGGPTVEIAAFGGSMYLGGPIQGTLGTEGLRLFAENGTAVITGAVGDPGGSLSSTKSLDYVVLGCCGVDDNGNPNSTGPIPSGSTGGVVTFEGPVTATNIIDERLTANPTLTTAAAIFEGPVTAGTFFGSNDNANDGVATELAQGGTFSHSLNFSDGPLYLAGTLTFLAGFNPGGNPSKCGGAASCFLINDNITAIGDGTLDESQVNDPIFLSATIAPVSAGGGSLSILAGTGAIMVASSASLGTMADPLHNLTLQGGTIDLNNGSIATAGTQTYNGAVTLSANTALSSTGSGSAGNITFDSTVSGSSYSLTLNSGGTITAAGGVNLGAFILQSGNWSQIGSPLPSFQAMDFELQGGTFVRALGGNGGDGNPYQLADIYGVQGMGTLLADNFVLANDIDASGTSGWNGGAGFMPIGGGGSPFSGTLDGQGHTISALTIDSGAANVGLFGTNAGTVSNLVLSNVAIVSTGTDAAAGALAGTNNGMIANVSASGTVSGQANHGGDAMLGGLVGFNGSTGTINGGSFANVAVSDTANYGDDYLGGLVALNGGTVFQTYAMGNVSGYGQGFGNGWGGLVGVLDGGTISQSFATGTVTNNSNVEPNLGGLVGKQTGGTIVNTFATGSVISNSANGGVYMGGLVGWQTGGSIATSYSIGLVQCPNQGCSQGGMIGVGGGTVDSASFWDTQTSGQMTSARGAGLTTTNAQSASFLTNMGWTFGGSSPWLINDGSSYPYLAWVGHPATTNETVSGVAPDGATVDLLIDGTSFGHVMAAPNGVFDFTLPSGTAGLALVYLPNGSADAVTPLSAGGATGLTLVTGNAVTLQGQGGAVQVSMLSTADGGVSASGILYSAAGGTMTLNPNVSLSVIGGSGNVTVYNAVVASGTGLVSISGAGIALAANITSAAGFALASPVTLNNSVTLTGGIGVAAFGSTVNTGANNITVVADVVTLASNESWSGTGTRTLYPFTPNSPITLAPNGGTTPASFNLTVADLADLAGGSPSMVTIGSASAPASGALTTGDFTFDVPMTLVGSSITIDPLTKNDGALTLDSSGAITGSVALGAGTGTLTISAGSLDMSGTVNGTTGSAVVPNIALVQPLGPGPFTFNDVNLLSPNGNNNTTTNPAATTIAQTDTNTNPPPPTVTNTAPPIDTTDTQPQQSTATTDLDTGATVFETISPTVPTDLTVSTSGGDPTLVAFANPPPVKAAVNDTAPPPHVVRPLGAYLGEALRPTVPASGVPGISFGYSLSGNSALW